MVEQMVIPPQWVEEEMYKKGGSGREVGRRYGLVMELP
jgi:hypothetical protein